MDRAIRDAVYEWSCKNMGRLHDVLTDTHQRTCLHPVGHRRLWLDSGVTCGLCNKTLPPRKEWTNGGLVKRITAYLDSGGLWNPEAMEHDKVRDLLIDCREALAAIK